ncbi:MAG TPA: extracellular solute-binding protein [Methylomirabilota bacterium]|nr:extracellular solute-binding protein [Methylomirabilota bacterium]
MIRRLALAAVVATFSLVTAASAGGGFTPDPVDLPAARKEGSVTWYTSTPVATAQKIATLFQQETGIKVELFRSGGSAVLRRFMQETDARRMNADVLTISDPAAASALIKRDLLLPFRPKNFDKVPEAVKDPRGYHIAQRLNLVGIVVRTDQVPEPPRTWTDLTDPKWKGKLVMPDPSFTAIQLMVVGTLSQKYGWDFYKKLRANDIMIVQSHQQVSDTLTRGERTVAAEGLDSYTWDARKAGHKVQTLFPADGAFAIAAPTMVIKGSPHPNAARALAEFMVGDTVQKLFPTEGIYAARSDVPPPPGNPPLASIKLMPVDYDHVEKEAKNLKNRFNEIYQ